MKRIHRLFWMPIVLLLSGCALGGLAAEAPDGSGNDVEAVIETTGDFEKTETAAEESAFEEVTTEAPIEVEGISYREPTVTVQKGDSFRLEIDVFPEDANQLGRIVWSSLNPTVVIADAEGNLTAIGSGTALILARMGIYTAVCQVTVEAPLRGVEIVTEGLDLDCAAPSSVALEYHLIPEDTTDEVTVSFESDNTEVLSVDSMGNLYPLSPGTAQITVTAGEFSDIRTLEVVSHLKKLSFAAEELELELGNTEKLSISYLPENTTDDLEITYKSSDPSVVSVDKEGNISALAAGTAQITASCQGISASCTVRVTVALTGISIKEETISLVKGAASQLPVQLNPVNATELPVFTYGTSNPGVVTIDGSGIMTAVGAGSAVVYANAGAFTASCTVTVFAPLQSIFLDQADISLWKGNTACLNVSYDPGDTTDDRTVTWSSSNPGVAIVANGVVTAMGDGVCTITATAAGKSASCIVRVATYVNVTGISLNTGAITLNSVGEAAQLTAAVLPANATEPGVTYSSSSPNVASVSASGVVTAVSGGTTVITATAGGRSASCTVTVNLPAAQKVVVLDPGHGGVDPGAINGSLMEKNLTLSVALYCKEYLEQNYNGVTVLLTRSTDTQLAQDETGTDLRTRCNYAASVGADVMVSLHFNTTFTHTSQGALALISKQPGVRDASSALANSILAQLAALGIQNRGPIMTDSSTLFDANGVALDYYAINRHCAANGMVGIIVEHCFMDNASDVGFCDTEDDLRKLGIADAIGIASYLGLTAK